jgi:hypothetical protein
VARVERLEALRATYPSAFTEEVAAKFEALRAEALSRSELPAPVTPQPTRQVRLEDLGDEDLDDDPEEGLERRLQAVCDEVAALVRDRLGQVTLADLMRGR